MTRPRARTAVPRPGRLRSTTWPGAASDPGRCAAAPRSVVPSPVRPPSGSRGHRGSRRAPVRSSRTAWRSASAASDGAISARWASDSSSRTDAVTTCVSPSWIAYARRARSLSTGPSRSRGDLEDLIGSSEALGGRGLAPERHRFHRPPVLLHGRSPVPAGSARACIGAHLRSLPPSQGMPSLFGLVLISVVRGGGLNRACSGRVGPQAAASGLGRLSREGETPGSGLRADDRARQHLREVEHLGAAAAGPLAVIEHDQAVGAGDPDGVGAG